MLFLILTKTGTCDEQYARVYINADMIVHYEECKTGTTISMIDGKHLHVSEDIHAINKIIAPVHLNQ